MIARKLESTLFSPVAAYARNRGFRQQRSEVPFYEYRIDLYGFSRRRNLTLAIELKVTKWRRAFQQALIYQLCSDLVYIAVPYSTSLSVERTLLELHGVGLVAVCEDGRCRMMIEAMQSSVVRHNYRREYVNSFGG
jgi:hypothetical protein